MGEVRKVGTASCNLEGMATKADRRGEREGGRQEMGERERERINQMNLSPKLKLGTGRHNFPGNSARF